MFIRCHYAAGTGGKSIADFAGYASPCYLAVASTFSGRIAGAAHLGEHAQEALFAEVNYQDNADLALLLDWLKGITAPEGRRVVVWDTEEMHIALEASVAACGATPPRLCLWPLHDALLSVGIRAGNLERAAVAMGLPALTEMGSWPFVVRRVMLLRQLLQKLCVLEAT